MTSMGNDRKTGPDGGDRLMAYALFIADTISNVLKYVQGLEPSYQVL